MELALTFATALILAIGLIPLTIRYAAKWRLVDLPGEDRKIHTQPIPRVGGIGIVFSAFVAVGYWIGEADELRGLFGGGAIIAIFGFMDDRYDLNYKLKFLGQILAVIPLLLSGMYIEVVPFLGLDPAPLWVSLPLTFFFVLGVINAVNLSDGLDGLAAGTTILSLGLLVVLALQSRQFDAALVGLGVIGSLLGFLRYNTHPASVFMGDAGSQFLGFITCALAIKITQYPAIAVSPVLPLVLVGLPVMDTFLVIALRLIQRRPPFEADRNHTHHQFMVLGFRHYEAVAAFYILQTALLGMAWALRYQGDGVLLGGYLLFCTCVISGIGLGRVNNWHLHPAQLSEGMERRNLFLRRFYWFYHSSPRLIEVMLAVFFIGVVSQIQKPTPGVAQMAIVLTAGGGILWALQHQAKWSAKVTTRMLVYTAGALLVYAMLIENASRPLFNMVVDVCLSSIMAILLVAIRMTRREVFSLDTQDLLIMLFILIVPLFSVQDFTDVAVGRFTLRFAVILYCCEYLLGQRREDYRLINIAVIFSMALLAMVY